MSTKQNCTLIGAKQPFDSGVGSRQDAPLDDVNQDDVDTQSLLSSLPSNRSFSNTHPMSWLHLSLGCVAAVVCPASGRAHPGSNPRITLSVQNFSLSFDMCVLSGGTTPLANPSWERKSIQAVILEARLTFWHLDQTLHRFVATAEYHHRLVAKHAAADRRPDWQIVDR